MSLSFFRNSPGSTCYSFSFCHHGNWLSSEVSESSNEWICYMSGPCRSSVFKDIPWKLAARSMVQPIVKHIALDYLDDVWWRHLECISSVYSTWKEQFFWNFLLIFSARWAAALFRKEKCTFSWWEGQCNSDNSALSQYRSCKSWLYCCISICSILSVGILMTEMLICALPFIAVFKFSKRSVQNPSKGSLYSICPIVPLLLITLHCSRSLYTLFPIRISTPASMWGNFTLLK